MPLEASSFFAYDSAGIVPVSSFTTPSTNTLQYTALPNAADTIHIVCQVTKTLSPKTKTLVQTTITVLDAAYTDTVNLGKADVRSLVGVFDASGENVSNRFILNTGQTDFVYGLGSLELIGDNPGDITVTFDYFTHSGSGDFLCVDSYTTLGADYIAKIHDYRSNIDAKIYELANCLDFRPRVNDSGTLGAGASLSNPPLSPSFFTSPVQIFVPRIDLVVMNANGVLSVKTGTASSRPSAPAIAADEIAIARVYQPGNAQTVDDISLASTNIRGYKMSDIAALERRIEQLESFATLNALENSLLTYEIIDGETGLNRFKSGYLVDNFDNPFTVCDYDNRNKSCFFRGRMLTTDKEPIDSQFHFMLEDSTNYSVTNSVLTLPYTEVPFIKQDQSSRVNNLNPFLVFDWIGLMTLTPAFDTWSVREDMPIVDRAVNNETVVQREEIVQIQIPEQAPAAAISSGGDSGGGGVTGDRMNIWLDGATGTVFVNSDFAGGRSWSQEQANEAAAGFGW